MIDSSSALPEPLLNVHGLTKNFGGSPALAGVDLQVMPGEVHGLLGENGSGKSTLIKVLAGYHAPDAGQIEVRGAGVELPLAPGQYRRLGFAFVHQDLALIPSLTVTENLFVEKFATTRGLRIDWAAHRRMALEICGNYGLDIDPTLIVDELEPVQRAILAIVRAVHDIDGGASQSSESRLLVLDEPTVFLPRQQVAQLFKLMRNIAARGSSVLFVSHDLNEVLEVTDRVTILRDGKVVGTRVTAQTDVAALVEMIVGRELTPEHESGRAKSTVQTAELLRVDNLWTRYLSGVSFSAREGEIVGLTGLLGSGHEDIPYAIFGARPGATGEMVLSGRHCSLASMTPRQAMSLGMALVPADRHRDGAIASLSVIDNVTAVTLNRYFQRLHLGRRRMRLDTATLAKQFDVRPRDPELDYALLSGGNQQKALLAKWLQLSPRVLLLHEPTQGVDIGARQQIFELLRSARAGRVVLCASSDHEQLAAVCDRVLVFGRGKLVSELERPEVTKERITQECLVSTVAEERLLL